MDLRKNIEDFDLVFFDLETTGLDAITGDAICEVGAIKIKERNETERFSSLVNPKKEIPQEAQSIHGISNEDVKSAPYFEEIVDKLTYFLQNSIILAYNVAFDMKFLECELKKINYPTVQLPAVDILTMARDTLKLPKYNLGALANFFKIETKISHRALEDAICASKVFFKLGENLKERGVQSLGDYISLYGFDNEFFQEKQEPKISALKAAIAQNHKLNIRYLSYEGFMKKEVVSPLKFDRERNFLYLWYQNSHASTLRLQVSRILEVAT